MTLFNNVAEQITDFEKTTIVPMIIDALAYKTQTNTVTSSNLSKWLTAYGYNVSDARVRKIISYISSAGIKNGKSEDLGDKVIIASGKGYFVTDDPRVCDDQIEDLTRRVDNMVSRIDSIKAQKQNLLRKKIA